MTSPTQAVTTDEGRYYTWPRFKKRHFPSITTCIKQGVPKPTMQAWERKKVAEIGIERSDDITQLKALHAQYLEEKAEKAK